MPMLDAFIPQGALPVEAEEKLLATLTDILIHHEGADPSNPAVRSIAWIFVHRPAAVFVAGAPATEPRYRFIPSVPEGQFTDERRRTMVEAITEAVLDAEAGAHSRDPMRVWVFPNEVPDGTWGGGGRIHTLADIAGFAFGDREKGRAYAEQVLAGRRGTPVAV
ncbi:tautomerase family protein [Pseudonocardia spinosispora]|uniref:tautomerase family protein n=1 Tax=Pseudonocardia spinosispora TaxID=103441 RepID=UPI000414D4A1|nr:tautomerase family protein [Pseudonocardia spinosispora]